MNESDFIVKVIRDLLVEVSQLRSELKPEPYDGSEAKNLIEALEGLNEQ